MRACRNLLPTILLSILLAFASGCTPMIYGVPEATWQTMSEAERVAAMEAYQQRQIAYQQQREAEARERARLQEIEQARQAAEEHHRQRRIEGIYRGQGVYGDLLRVRIQGGEMKISGKHRSFQPLAFRIAAEETVHLEVRDSKGRQSDLVVSYDGSTLILDSDQRGSHGTQFAYNQSWGRGWSYSGVSSRGPLKLKGVEIYVEVAGHQPPDHQRADRRERFGDNPSDQHRHPGDERHGQDDQTAPPPGWKKPHPSPPPVVIHPPAEVRVSFRAGEVRSGRRYLPLTPVAVSLKDGEQRQVHLKSAKGSATVVVVYRQGAVSLYDSPAALKRRAELASMAFDRDWREGKNYRFEARQWSDARDIQLEVASLD